MDELDEIKTEGELAAEALAKENEAQQPEGETPKEEPAEETKTDDKPVETEKTEEEQQESVYGKPGHTPPGVQKRINQLTRDNRELKDSYNRVLREMNELKKKVDPQREPTKEDFLKAGKTEEEYMNFVIDKRAREVASQMLKDQDEQREFDNDLKSFNESVERARSIFPDYDEVVYGGEDIPASNELSTVLRKMKNGGDVIYTLQKNENIRKQFLDAPNDEAKKKVLNDLSAHLQKLYDDAMNKQTPSSNQQQATPAPAPSAPRQTAQLREPGEITQSTTKKKLDPSKCTMEEWMTDGY